VVLVRYATRLAVLLALVALGGRHARGEETLPELLRRVGPSCVTLHLKTAAGGEVSGIGFLVDGETVATSRHVILGCTGGSIEFQDAERAEIRGVVADDPHADVALVRFEPSRAGAVPLQPAERPAEAKQRVAFLNSPVSRGGVLQEGVVSSMDPHPIYRECIHVAGEVRPESRGSPLIDLTGHLVGMVVASMPGEPLQGLAVPWDRVRVLQPGLPVGLRRWNYIPSSGAQEYVDAGDRVFAAGDLKAAMLLYEMADQRDDGCPLAVVRRMYTLSYQCDPGGAHSIGKEAIERWPGYVALWRAYHESDRTVDPRDKTLERQWLAHCPEDPAAYEALIYSPYLYFRADSRVPDREEAISTAALVDPDGVGCLEQRLDDAWRRDPDEAGRILEAVRGHLRDASSHHDAARCALAYGTLLNFAFDHHEGPWVANDSAYRRSLFEEGMEFIRHCLETTAPSPRRCELAHAASSLLEIWGNSLSWTKEGFASPAETTSMLEALEAALRYAQEQPRVPNRLTWGDVQEGWCRDSLANVLADLGRTEQAVKHLDAIIEMYELHSWNQPYTPGAYLLRGDLASADEEWLLAIRAYLRSMQLYGKPAVCMTGLARAMLAAGFSGEEGSGVEAIVRRRASLQKTSVGEDLFVIGMAYLRIEEYAGAVATLGRLKEEDRELAQQLLRAVRAKLGLGPR